MRGIWHVIQPDPSLCMPPSLPDAFKGPVDPTLWPTASIPFVLLHFYSGCTLWCLMLCMKCLSSCLSSIVSGTNSKVLQRSSLGPLDIPAPPRTAHCEREGQGRNGCLVGTRSTIEGGDLGRLVACRDNPTRARACESCARAMEPKGNDEMDGEPSENSSEGVSSLQEAIQTMVDRLQAAKKDASKFERGMDTAGVRLRAQLNTTSKDCSKLRKAVQDIRKKRKSAKTVDEGTP